MTTTTTRTSLTGGQLLALLLGSALVGVDSGTFATYGSHLLEEAALSSSQLQQLWLTSGLFTLIAAFGGGLLLRRLSRRQVLPPRSSGPGACCNSASDCCQPGCYLS